jgi:hypothetical protein
MEEMFSMVSLADGSRERLGETTESRARGVRDARLKKTSTKDTGGNITVWAPFVHYGA